MLNIKTKNRILIFLSIFVLSIILTIFLFKTLRNNVLYFYSPSEVSKVMKMPLKTILDWGVWLNQVQ